MQSVTDPTQTTLSAKNEAMEEWKVEWLGQPTVFIHQQKPLGAHKKSNNEKKGGAGTSSVTALI